MRYNGLFANVPHFPFYLKLFCFPALVLILIFSFAAQAAMPSGDTDEVKKLLKQATKLRRSGAFDQAETILRQAIEIDPKRSDAKVELAYIFTKQRKTREAYDLAFKVAEAERQNSRAFAARIL